MAQGSGISSAERSAPAPRLVKEVVLKDHRVEQGGGRTPRLPDSLLKLQGLEEAQRLRKYNETHLDPRDALKRAHRAEPALSDAEQTQLQKIDPTLATEARQFDDYSGVVDEARRTHRTIEEVCKAREKAVPPQVDAKKRFTEGQRAVVDRMMQADYVTDRIPGYKDLSLPEKKVAVEAYVAAHPGVREIYISQVRAIAREALSLGEDPTESATKTKTETVDRLKTERTAEEKKIREKLGPQANNLSEGEIADLVATGASVEQVEMALLDKVLKTNNIEPADYSAYQELQRMHALEREFQEVHRKGPHAGQNFDIGGYISGNDSEQVSEYKRLQARQPEKPHSFNEAELKVIKATEDAIFGEVRYIRGVPLPIGGVRAELQTIRDNLVQERQVETQKMPVSPDVQAKAEAARAGLKDRLTIAMENSIEEALIRDYDELDEINQRKIQSEMEDAGERESRAIDVINRRQKEHGVKTGTEGEEKGKKVINRTEIGKDVRRIAQDGQEGLKRIALRNLSEGSDPIIRLTDEAGKAKYFVDKDGKPCEAGAAGAKAATWETIDYSQLSQEDRALLNKMHETQSDRLAQTIVVDYFFARKPPTKRWGPMQLIRGYKDTVMKGQPEELKLSTAQEADLVHFVGSENIKSFFQESRDFTSLKDALAEVTRNPGKTGGILMTLLAIMASLGGLRGKKEEYV